MCVRRVTPPARFAVLYVLGAAPFSISAEHLIPFGGAFSAHLKDSDERFERVLQMTCEERLCSTVYGSDCMI